MDKFDFKVLYAEDNHDVRVNYEELLKYYFGSIYTAKDGQEAYDKYLKYSPDILLLDVNMPKLSGLEVAKKIRKNDQNVKIIMLTAMDEKEYLLDAIKLQLCEYLIKPVKTTQLEKVLIRTVQDIKHTVKAKHILKLQGNCYWDKEKKLLFQNNQIVKLTKKEYKLVSLLCSSPFQVFDTVTILNEVWEDEIDKAYDTLSLRSLISRMKNKLDTQIFESIYNVGYRIKL